MRLPRASRESVANTCRSQAYFGRCETTADYRPAAEWTPGMASRERSLTVLPRHSAADTRSLYYPCRLAARPRRGPSLGGSARRGPRSPGGSRRCRPDSRWRFARARDGCPARGRATRMLPFASASGGSRRRSGRLRESRRGGCHSPLAARPNSVGNADYEPEKISVSGFFSSLRVGG
jgi:hypothetical protein